MSSRVLGVDSEVLRSLPEHFLFRYEQLWGMAFLPRPSKEIEPNVVSSTRAVTRTSTGQTETRGGAHKGKKLAGAAERSVITNESALLFKRKIDAGIRKLNREMKYWIETQGASGVGRSRGRRCSVCKRFGDEDWVYCPWDGRPMEEAEVH